MVRKRQRLANPIGQYIINVMLQMFAIAAAVVFGYFAVQSVRISDRAYKEAYLANQIAIYAVCNANDYIVSNSGYSMLSLMKKHLLILLIDDTTARLL